MTIFRRQRTQNDTYSINPYLILDTKLRDRNAVELNDEVSIIELNITDPYQ